MYKYRRYSYYRRSKTLKTELSDAIKNGGGLSELMAKPGNDYKYFSKFTNAKMANKIADTTLRSPYGIKFINSNLVPYWTIDKVSATYWWGKSGDLPKILDIFSDVYTEDTKKNLVEYFIVNNKNMYSYIRKLWVSVILPWVEKESDALEIIKKCHKIISPSQMEALVNKLPDGENNPDIQKIIEKSKVLKYSMLSEQEINSNPELRKQFIKDVAKTISVAKKSKFDVKVTLDELKGLPSMTRFDFLSKALTYEIYYCRSKYWADRGSQYIYDAIRSRKKYLNYDKIQLPEITLDEMKELVFAATIKNHSKVSNFLEGYKKYLEVRKDVDKVKKPSSN